MSPSAWTLVPILLLAVPAFAPGASAGCADRLDLVAAGPTRVTAKEGCYEYERGAVQLHELARTPGYVVRTQAVSVAGIELVPAGTTPIDSLPVGGPTSPAVPVFVVLPRSGFEVDVWTCGLQNGVCNPAYRYRSHDLTPYLDYGSEEPTGEKCRSRDLLVASHRYCHGYTRDPASVVVLP